MKPILLATLLLLPAPAFAEWNRIDDTKELKRYLCSTDRMLGGKRQKSDCAVLRVKGRALESARSKGKGRVAKYRRQ